ncbi:hypothetical protein HPB48_017429 [Haemaphysalis longicornis]|uniref:PiggyBac transposable element-derived protein domain-containing protein n=1 Tax=Haemaphysalis longicornis TaxID=44386 RepID=A0A9J6GCA3_HAELO|nr:hypothetical protein HPB48_017429 [Haemaphysalis longicornis]
MKAPAMTRNVTLRAQILPQVRIQRMISLELQAVLEAQKRIEFSPRREPGVYLGDDVAMALRSGTKKFLTAMDFFPLFFSAEVVGTICDNSNKYAWTRILEKPTHARPDGSWEEVTPSELLKFIGLVIYMGIVKVPRLKLYWNIGSLYSGLLARRIMPRKRFIALLALLQIADLDDPEPTVKRKAAGYKIFMDNFYTSTHLFDYLLDRKTLACGTTRKDRRGFPKELKESRWEKKAKRGDIRWMRDGKILTFSGKIGAL